MKIHKNFNIINSLGIKSIAKFFIEIENIKDFEELFNFISSKDTSSTLLIIGEGTNLVLPETFDGIVVKPIFNHINYDKINNLISVGASVNWDYFVDLMVKDNIFGFENLSLIPGSVGAAPIQNIGAYGQSISSLISSIDCFDFKLNKFVNLFGSNSILIDCTFSIKESLLDALEKIKKEAEIAVRQGVTQLILTDKEISTKKLPMPMLLCVGAINTFLIEKKLRGYVSINVQSGEAMDTHSFATLIGVGATTVNPYLAFDSLYPVSYTHLTLPTKRIV